MISIFSDSMSNASLLRTLVSSSSRFTSSLSCLLQALAVLDTFLDVRALRRVIQAGPLADLGLDAWPQLPRRRLSISLLVLAISCT